MPSRSLSPRQIELVADRFKALAEPSRLRILQALRTRERTVTELMAETGFGQANLSKHLQVLHAAGFLTRRKEGVSVYYALADPDVFALCDLVCGRIERELAEQRRALR